MNRYRVTYTAYLPEPKIDINELRANRAQDPEGQRRMRELDDYTKRLDRQNYKLESADDVCMSQLDKVNRYFASAQVRESRLDKSLNDSKRILRSKSSGVFNIDMLTPKSAVTTPVYQSPRSSTRLIEKYLK